MTYIVVITGAKIEKKESVHSSNKNLCWGLNFVRNANGHGRETIKLYSEDAETQCI